MRSPRRAKKSKQAVEFAVQQKFSDTILATAEFAGIP
jgi:hypothetical protein